MVVYNFKTIVKVPGSKELIDIILSRTQRKTPTVCHKGWYIQRIRDFYARKVKFTCESFTEKLTQMLNDFPRVDDIHPYYADLINVLYSKHHYKLALGQISTARTLIEHIAKDTLKYLKYAETQYRCKCQKRAALGRMATIARKLNTSLGYLERVRQHMSRLPSIDPNTRTVIITGFPNVGKSSFINKVSRADVEVQNYAFTTKSAHVGHFDHLNYRWQIVDTPGILDHSLEDRNIIEMQAITALAHLNATVLFFIDISESHYTIKKQASLYHSIKALFSNKPLLVVANKTDLKAFDALEPEDRALIDAIAADRNTQVIPMSNHTEDGVSKVKATACEMLLRFRCERSMQSAKIKSIANRINIATPTPRDGKERPAAIPDAVLARREKEAAARELLSKNLREEGLTDEEAIDKAVTEQIESTREKRVTLKDIVEQNGGSRNFTFDYRTYWDLANPEHRFDTIPEIMDGKNVADFFDPDIEARLEELEREENELEAAFEEAGLGADDVEDELTEEQFILLQKIRSKKQAIAEEARLRHGRGNNHSASMPRHKIGQSLKAAQERLGEIGLDTTKFTALVQKQSATKVAERGRSRKRALEDADNVDYPGVSAAEEVERARSRSRAERMGDGAAGSDESDTDERGRSRSVARSVSRMRNHPSHARSQSRMRGTVPERGDGYKDFAQKLHADKLERHTWKRETTMSRTQSNRHVYDEKPRHLFEGKRGMGKTDRR